MNTTQAQIRKLLRNSEDGLTPPEIGKILHRKSGHVHKILEVMEKIDAYVDRWEPCPCPGGFSPVWMVVTPPQSCPRPDPRPSMKFPERNHSATP